MTNEETIKRIHRFVETYKICGKDNYNPTTNITKLDYEAFKSAIESLEQQPCEDCISRQAIKEMLTEEWTKYMPMEMDVNLSFVLEKINETPSVTPQAITLEKAIDYLHEIGWMQVHDKEIAQPQPSWIPASERSLENATNGDMIKAMFPDVEVKEKNNGYEIYFGVGTAVQYFNHQWWNAKYKAESVRNDGECRSNLSVS